MSTSSRLSAFSISRDDTPQKVCYCIGLSLLPESCPLIYHIISWYWGGSNNRVSGWMGWSGSGSGWCIHHNRYLGGYRWYNMQSLPSWACNGIATPHWLWSCDVMFRNVTILCIYCHIGSYWGIPRSGYPLKWGDLGGLKRYVFGGHNLGNSQNKVAQNHVLDPKSCNHPEWPRLEVLCIYRHHGEHNDYINAHHDIHPIIQHTISAHDVNGCIHCICITCYEGCIKMGSRDQMSW